MNGALSRLFEIHSFRSKRISSYNRPGGNHDCISIDPGKTATIARIDGAGIIRHIWFTINHPDKMHRRNMVLRIFWDGEKSPSVECPVGDFFGQGWGENYNYTALPLAAAPANGRALNCYFPMPFGNGARIEIENQSKEPCRSLYYYVDYDQAERLDKNIGRFHAFWNRSINPSALNVEHDWSIVCEDQPNLTDRFNHLILDARGHGHYVGVNYYVDCPTPLWYGEGDDMWFIDGQPWPPSLHGTGTEDYFNSSWCPKEVYIHPYFGYPRVNGNVGWMGRTHCYRFHIEDPIRFDKSLRGSIEMGHANGIAADFVTVAYWYQTEPHKIMRPLPPANMRQNMPDIGVREIHRWRMAFREAHGGKMVWGNEDFPPRLKKQLAGKIRSSAKKLTSKAAARAAEAETRKQKKMLKGR